MEVLSVNAGRVSFTKENVMKLISDVNIFQNSFYKSR